MVWDLENEIKSINCQFFLFLFAYMTRIFEIIAFQLILNEYYYEKIDKKYIDMTYAITAFFTQIIPTFMLLFLHYKAFNPRVNQQKAEHNSIDETDSDVLITADKFEFNEIAETLSTKENQQIGKESTSLESLNESQGKIVIEEGIHRDTMSKSVDF